MSLTESVPAPHLIVKARALHGLKRPRCLIPACKMSQRAQSSRHRGALWAGVKIERHGMARSFSLPTIFPEAAAHAEYPSEFRTGRVRSSLTSRS